MAGDQERVGPCFDVHARLETGNNNALPNVESGAWVGAGPIIQHHYEMLAIGCVLD